MDSLVSEGPDTKLRVDLGNFKVSSNLPCQTLEFSCTEQIKQIRCTVKVKKFIQKYAREICSSSIRAHPVQTFAVRSYESIPS